MSDPLPFTDAELDEVRNNWESEDGHNLAGFYLVEGRLLATIARLRERAGALEAELAKARTSETITMWRGAATLERAGFTVVGLDAEVKRLEQQAEALAAALARIAEGEQESYLSCPGVPICSRTHDDNCGVGIAVAALRAYREATP